MRLLICLFLLALPMLGQRTTVKQLLLGNGAPPAGRCAGLGAVATQYKDLAVNGKNYECNRIGANSFRWDEVGSGSGGAANITAGSSGLLVVSCVDSNCTIDGDTAFLCNRTGNCVFTGSWDASGASSTAPVKAGTTEPASCTPGKDLFLNTTGPTLKYCNGPTSWATLGGGGGGGVDPAATVVFEEEFLTWNAGSGGNGRERWHTIGTNANSGFFNTSISRPGQPRLSVLNIGDNLTFFNLAANSFEFGGQDDWYFVINPSLVNSTVGWRCGLTDDQNTIPSANGVWIEKLPADTQMFGLTRAAGVSSTRVNTGVTAVVDTWYVLRMRRVGANWRFSIANTISGLGGATEFTVSTNIPGTGIQYRPFCYSNSTANNGWSGIWWDYVRGTITLSGGR
jgi:hypothetical protein